MEYLTSWIGKRLQTPDGSEVGSVTDLIATDVEPLPHIVAVQVKTPRGPLYLPIGIFEQKTVSPRLSRPLAESDSFETTSAHFSLRKAVLDRQILDLNGKRVVRVNDVALIWRRDVLYIVGVEAGLLSLLRRMNLDGVAMRLPKPLRRRLAARIIGWNAVEAFGGAITLRVTHEKIAQLHPADIADIVEQLDPARRAEVFDSLDLETAADTLEETHPDVQKEIITSLDVERAADIVEEMEPDEAADLLGELSEEHSEELLQHMEEEEAAEVKELLAYDEDTAGGIMTTEFVAIPQTLTCEQTINRLRELHPEAETIYYVYVLDEDDQLVGVLSLRDLIVAQPDTLIADIMVRKVIAAHVDNSLEDVKQMFGKYSLLALPVINVDNRLQGIITVDDILDG